MILECHEPLSSQLSDVMYGMILSMLNDFQFHEDIILARRASDIGPGKPISVKPMIQPGRYVCKLFKSNGVVIDITDDIDSKLHFVPENVKVSLLTFKLVMYLDEISFQLIGI